MTKEVKENENVDNIVATIAASSKLNPKDYPPSWNIDKLGDVIDIKGGSQPPKSTFRYEPQEGYIRLLQIRDFGDKPVPTYVPKEKVTKFCTKDDIFIARYGASLGRLVTGMEGAYNVALAKVIFDKDVFFPKYLFHLLQTPLFQTPIHMISRSAQNGFNKGEIFPIELPRAPLPEQKLIVAEIDKQFSRLDDAVAALKRIKANLKRYKASVLKAAVDGKLTEEWRKEHPDVEPARELLKRILVERRKKWEIDHPGKKYKEPSAPDTSNLPELPTGWVWTSLEMITESMGGYAFKSKKFTDSGHQIVKMANIKMETLDLSQKPSFMNDVPDEIVEKYQLLNDDILITLTGTRKKRDYGYVVQIKKPKTSLLLNQRIASVLSLTLLYT